MDAFIDALIAFLRDFKAEGAATKFGVVAAAFGLVALCFGWVRARIKRNFETAIETNEALKAEIVAKDEILKDKDDEIASMLQSHPDTLLSEIEREIRDKNDELADQKSAILFDNVANPLATSCCILAENCITRAIGSDWADQLEQARRYATIGHLLDPSDDDLGELVFDLASAKMLEADLAQDFQAADPRKTKFFPKFLPQARTRQ